MKWADTASGHAQVYKVIFTTPQKELFIHCTALDDVHVNKLINNYPSGLIILLLAFCICIKGLNNEDMIPHPLSFN